jgi:sugar phosphate isomerase/epimerase
MTTRLAVSNLAWPAEQEDAAFALLAHLGVPGVEVAPTRLAPWDELSVAQLADYRTRLTASGLVVSSLQALLFGRPELQLLGEQTVFAAMLEHIRRVSEVAAQLGGRVMVFGSPRNRLRGKMAADAAWAMARERLGLLGEIAAAADVAIGVEPVPAFYGGDFLTVWQDVLRMVEEVASPGLQVHLDTGCVSLGGGAIQAAVDACAHSLAHFHAAQPQLGPFDDPTPTHAQAGAALQRIGYERWVAIEMREQPGDPLAAVAQAVRFVRSAYPIDGGA